MWWWPTPYGHSCGDCAHCGSFTSFCSHVHSLSSFFFFFFFLQPAAASLNCDPRLKSSVGRTRHLVRGHGRYCLSAVVVAVTPKCSAIWELTVSVVSHLWASFSDYRWWCSLICCSFSSSTFAFLLSFLHYRCLLGELTFSVSQARIAVAEPFSTTSGWPRLVTVWMISS